MSERVGGRYEPLEVAGRGGQGEVLRAWDHHHRRPVALKIRRIAGDDQRAAVLTEVRALLQLEPHTCLPVVRDDFFDRDRHVIVMDWVEGVSLARLVAERGDPGLAASAVLSYLERAADALDHLHGHDPPIVHGDVKPANLVVTRQGHVVLVDFGSATMTGAVSTGGTPGYAAPELAAGSVRTPAADVYGLAATAFALLTGTMPTGVRPTWEGLDPATVPALERALRRGLAIDPTRRPASAGEFVSRLRAWRAADLPAGVVTFCLTDIEDSTRLWEEDPRVMAAALARHDALIAQVVEDRGGRLIKSQGEGDSTLSVFARATDAAAAASALVVSIDEERRAGTLPLNVRVALHTGEATPHRGDYFGPALNRAACVRNIAKGGQVLVSRAAAELLRNVVKEFVLVDLGDHEVDGIGGREHVFQLVDVGRSLAHEGALDVIDRGASSPTPIAPAPLFGRRGELGLLGDALTSALAGQGSTVLIGGEPGIGKTRLTEELSVVAGEHRARVLWGRCYEEEGTPAFWPWTRMLEAQFANSSADALRTQLGSGAPFVVGLVPELSSRLPEVHPAPTLEPKEARFRQFDAVTKFFAAASRTQPTVLILEDLHWADIPSLLLLRFVAREVHTMPLLLVGTYRDVELTRTHPLADALAELGRHSSTQRVTLHGLSSADVGAFISNELGSEADDALVERVYRQTEGNPFFVAEVLRLLISEGPAATRSESVALPESVRDVLARRLDRLTSSTRALLTLASVIGRQFEVRVLESVAGATVDAVTDALDEARAAHLVREVIGSTIRYRFEHALVRQTLYEEMSAVRRFRLHRGVADAIERMYGEDPGSHLSDLAYHFTEASRLEPNDEAVAYSRRAAERASAVLAYEEASEHYQRALDSLDRVDEREGRLRAQLLVSLGDAQTRAGELGLARETFREAASTARRFDAGESLAGAALGFATLSPVHMIDKDAVELLESALAILPRDQPLAARVLARLANVLFLSDDDERLDELSREAVAIAQRANDPMALAETLSLRHGCVRGPGVMPQRIDLADEVIALAHRCGSIEYEVQGLALRYFDLLALGDMSAVEMTSIPLRRLVAEVRGRWGAWEPRIGAMRAMLEGDLAAEQLALEALTVSQEHQDPNAFELFGIQVAHIRREQDRAADVEPGIRSLTEQFPEIATWKCGLAALLAEQGRTDDAYTLLEELGRADFGALPAKSDFRQMALVLLADACIMLEDDRYSSAVLRHLRPYFAENVLVGPALDCYGSAARPIGALATLLGQYEEAEAALEHALEFNTALGSHRWVAHTQVDVARLLTRRARPGDHLEAAKLLDTAHRTAAARGLPFVARRADAAQQALDERRSTQ